MTSKPEEKDGRRSQAARAQATQARLIEAAIENLDRLGYASTSISTIQTRAGVSRGALMHHYATKTDLFVAVAKSLLEAAIRPTLDADRYLDGPSRSVGELIAFYWHRVMNTREGRAFVEILVACRTDRQLDAALSQLFRDWDQQISAAAARRFAGLGGGEARAALLWSICRTFLRGLVIHSRFVRDEAEVEKLMLGFAALVETQLHAQDGHT